MIVRVVEGGRENNNLICVCVCSLTQLIFSIVFLFSKGRRGQLARFVFDFALIFMVCNSLFWFVFFLSLFLCSFALCLSVKVVIANKENRISRARWMDFMVVVVMPI